MSTIKKTLVFIGALIWMSFGAGTPDLTSTLVFDDFDDAYGDAANQATLGAVKSWAEKGRTSTLSYGYWYKVSTAPYGYVVAGVSTHDTIGTENTKQLIDGHIMHFFFKLNPDTSASDDAARFPSTEVSCIFYKNKTDSIDLSKMTSISFKAKGTGKIWVGIMTEKINHISDWGTMGDTISLKAAMTSVSLPLTKLLPIPYSKAETNGYTWSDCKSACYGFQIKSWDSKNAEVYIDSIVFEGMHYSDVMAKVGVKQSFSAPAAYSNALISINNAMVSYKINQAQNVSISLFNANGKEMGNLFTGNASVGTHSVALPKSIIPGTYFIRMNNTQGVLSHKFTIVK
jgi:hypothetical protein